jgi:cysteine-rich repeat protein
MRKRALSLAVLLGTLGCSSILGIRFDDYREGEAGTELQLDCVPQSVSRCLCELDEGFRTCDDSGHLGTCICDGGADVASARPGCGNATLDQGEACDDGNAEDGDGCSTQCLPDGRPAAVEQCPGQNVFLWGKEPVAFQLVGADQAASINDGGPDAGSCATSPQPDRVLELTSNVPGTLQVSVVASVDTFVSLRTTCDVPGSAVSCVRATVGKGTMQTVDVLGSQPVFLILEPVNASPTATFSIEVTPL